MDDRTVLRMLYERDESVLGEIRKTHGRGCISLANNYLNDRRDAEEVFSDALLTVWNSIPPDSPGSFTAYLYRTVRNMALARYRDMHRQKREGDLTAVALDDAEGFIPGGGDPAESLTAAELGSVISAYLKSLPETDRNVFVCRYFHNMQLKDIKKKLGLGLRKIRNSLTRSREGLREKLKKEGYYYE